ncbi:MAG: hypothetical protein Q7U05_12965 [Polaromonas sp.]|nr:hypothetical protein [Polaromonas sp.]
MSQTHTGRTRITEEELLALLGPIVGQSPSAHPVRRANLANAGVDVWFKFRMLFLLAVVTTYTGKLLFFPALAAANYDLGASAVSLSHYFQYRAGFVILISAVYLYSYLKDWHFEQVSLVFLGVGVTALVLDYFNAYMYLSQTPMQWVAGLIALRFLAIFCLLMNAMNARHAPPAPRRLWS